VYDTCPETKQRRHAMTDLTSDVRDIGILTAVATAQLHKVPL